MSQVAKLAAWVAVAYFCLLLPAAVVVLVLAVSAEEQRASILGLGALLLLPVCIVGVRWLFARHVSALRELAEQTRVISGANAELRLPIRGAREVAELATAINGLAEAYSSLRRESESRAAEARRRLEEERNRLAVLMSELAQGVLVCNPDGTILLYNDQAKALFAAGGALAGDSLVGLGRSLFALVDRSQVAHGVQRLQRGLERRERAPTVRFMASTPAKRVARVLMAPYLDAAAGFAGLVLVLEDVTELLEREAQRRSLLQTFAARIREPVASIRATAENLSAFPDLDAGRRSQFIDIVASESRLLSAIITDALREYADALKAALTLDDMRAADLLELARLRIDKLGATAEPAGVEEELWLRVDSYALVLALVTLAARLLEDYGVRRLDLRARAAQRFVELDLAWSGAIVASEALSLWELQPMEAVDERSPLTIREVMEQHGGEVWFQADRAGGVRGGCFRFLLPRAEAPLVAAAASRTAASRPEYYDFDLFTAGAPEAMQNALLSALSYTAFDTETTGLEPSAGDEIISIGAVRIVNGRLLRSEVFERLVDPGRTLNPESARVHGIDAAALQGQPSIREVLPLFERFCAGTVLVGHNAAFDMRFLELKRRTTGVRFAQPVLDTLLLSAAAHPGLDDHRLEAIAARLGISVIGRHTALGDALLTGEIFLKLLPLLAGRGVLTLGQALAASRETYYARLQY